MEYQDTLISVGDKEYSSIEEYEAKTGDTKTFQNIKNFTTMDLLESMSRQPRPVSRLVSPGIQIPHFASGPALTTRKVVATIRTNCGSITVYNNNSLTIKDYVSPPDGDVSSNHCSDIDRFVSHLKECGVNVQEIMRA